ncbi:MAG: hypothetical protein KDD15_29560, partial [Lewinella sp.]|nr:hypothetical protein [Lewinella sp.]
MMQTRITGLYSFILMLGLLISACQSEPSISEKELRITPISVPADSFSMFPSLRMTPNGELLMNWLYEPDTVSQLLMARLDKDQQWAAPLKIAAGTDWFINWADFSSLAVGPNDHLVTYSLPKSSDDTYA